MDMNNGKKEGYIMKIPIFTMTAVTVLFLVACGGGGSSSSSGSSDEIPLGLSVDNLDLTAGVPIAFTYKLPKPPDPYTQITIDIGRTLREANITVTPQ